MDSLLLPPCIPFLSRPCVDGRSALGERCRRCLRRTRGKKTCDTTTLQSQGRSDLHWPICTSEIGPYWLFVSVAACDLDFTASESSPSSPSPAVLCCLCPSRHLASVRRVLTSLCAAVLVSHRDEGKQSRLGEGELLYIWARLYWKDDLSNANARESNREVAAICFRKRLRRLERTKIADSAAQGPHSWPPHTHATTAFCPEANGRAPFVIRHERKQLQPLLTTPAAPRFHS